jgi:hypothetical protein
MVFELAKEIELETFDQMILASGHLIYSWRERKGGVFGGNKEQRQWRYLEMLYKRLFHHSHPLRLGCKDGGTDVVRNMQFNARPWLCDLHMRAILSGLQFIHSNVKATLFGEMGKALKGVTMAY